MNSTALNPASAAALKRSRNGSSVNSIERLAAKRGMMSSPGGGASARLTSRAPARSRGHRSALVRERFRRLFLRGPHVLALPDRELRVQAEDLLELVHPLDLRSHRDVGDPLEAELEHHRNVMFLHELVGSRESGLELVRALDPDRLATESLGDRHVVHPVARHRVALE